MATTPSPSRSRVRTGLLLITGMGLLAISVFFIDVAVRATAEGARVTVLAQSAPGLRPGSAVWVAGRPMGRVLSIAFRPPGPSTDNVVIRAALDRVAEPIVRADASVEVRASDLLAPVIVAIDPGSGAAPPWDYADTLRASGPPLDPEAMLALADTLLGAVEALEVQASAARSVLTTGSGAFQRFRADPELIRGMQRDLDRIQSIIDRDLPGSTLARMATDTLVGSATRRISDRLAAWDAAPERESSRRSLEAATGAIADMGDRLASLVERLERGEGTAGRALVDGEIERQLRALRIVIAKLTDDLTYDPSRWLRVRVF